MYIIVFNLGYRDVELHTNSNGFVCEYATLESAKETAGRYIDGKTYRCYTIYYERLTISSATQFKKID